MKRNDMMSAGEEVRAIAHSARNGNDELPFTILQTRRTTLRYTLLGLPFVRLPMAVARELPSSLVVQRYKTETKLETSLSLIGRVRYGRAARAIETVQAFKTRTAVEQSNLLRRITQTRKITTGVLRLLVPKNDALRGLRKRLGELRAHSLARSEVFIYLSDVHDHTLGLINQLQIGETQLGDMHHAYLNSLSIYNRRIRQSLDHKIINLVTITTVVMMLVFITSLFSFNFPVPTNKVSDDSDEEQQPIFWWFGIIIALQAVAGTAIVVWRAGMLRQSQKRLNRMRAAR